MPGQFHQGKIFINLDEIDEFCTYFWAGRHQRRHQKYMNIDDSHLFQIRSDLGINHRFAKGQPDVEVRRCWHFSTDGTSVDVLFRDDDDFKDGMNRIALLLRECAVVILAFALMDNHAHFVLYGEVEECGRFMKEYCRRTSMHISSRHGERGKLGGIQISCQKIDNQQYLKTAICYVLRNPTVAGLPVSPLDYPWSSGPLMFRTAGTWSSPCWTGESMRRLGEIGSAAGKAFFKSHAGWDSEWRMVGDLVFPGDYVAYGIAEELFRSNKAFLFFLGMNKESEVEALAGRISNLAIPDSEMRQHKNELCREMFGTCSAKCLDIQQRVVLAKALRRRYQSSVKQIARVCGLVYNEIKDLI